MATSDWIVEALDALMARVDEYPVDLEKLGLDGDALERLAEILVRRAVARGVVSMDEAAKLGGFALGGFLAGLEVKRLEAARA